MKKISLVFAIASFLLICSDSTVAQNTQTKLNQVELMKKFLGSWECDVSKDTIAYWDFRPFGTGLECYVKYVTMGKIIKEVKSLYGYDRTIDKYIAAGITKGMDMQLFAIWFLSDKTYRIIFYSDVPSPEKAIVKNDGEFKSPDLINVTKVVNNKPVNTLIYKRIFDQGKK